MVHMDGEGYMHIYIYMHKHLVNTWPRQYWWVCAGKLTQAKSIKIISPSTVWASNASSFTLGRVPKCGPASAFGRCLAKSSHQLFTSSNTSLAHAPTSSTAGNKKVHAGSRLRKWNLLVLCKALIWITMVLSIQTNIPSLLLWIPRVLGFFLSIPRSVACDWNQRESKIGPRHAYHIVLRRLVDYLGKLRESVRRKPSVKLI